jgi:hypothetical protein
MSSTSFWNFSPAVELFLMTGWAVFSNVAYGGETLRLEEERKTHRQECPCYTESEGRCGGRGSRTYRRTLPAANGLSRIFDDRGPLDGGHIVADSIPDSLNPDGTATGAIRTPKGIMGRTQASSRRLWNQGSDSRSAFNGLPGSSVPPYMQRFVATKKTVGKSRGGQLLLI